MKIQKAIKGSTGPIGDEVDRARDLISAGKSDGAVAAAISAARRHGQLPVHPQQIAQLRKGF